MSTLLQRQPHSKFPSPLPDSQGIRSAKRDPQQIWQNSSSCGTRCLLTCLMPMFLTDFELLPLALRSKQTVDGDAAFRTLARLHGHSTSIVCPEPRHHGCSLAKRLAQNKTTKTSDLLLSTCPLRDRFHVTSIFPPVLVPPPGSKYFPLMPMSDTHFLFFFGLRSRSDFLLHIDIFRKLSS